MTRVTIHGSDSYPLVRALIDAVNDLRARTGVPQFQPRLPFVIRARRETMRSISLPLFNVGSPAWLLGLPVEYDESVPPGTIEVVEPRSMLREVVEVEVEA